MTSPHTHAHKQNPQNVKNIVAIKPPNSNYRKIAKHRKIISPPADKTTIRQRNNGRKNHLTPPNIYCNVTRIHSPPYCASDSFTTLALYTVNVFTYLLYDYKMLWSRWNLKNCHHRPKQRSQRSTEISYKQQTNAQ